MKMIVLDTCFFDYSLETCAFICLVFYLIVSVYRFVNGIIKFNVLPAWIATILETRHVIWSIVLILEIYGIYSGNGASYLKPCLWIQAIDLAETIIDYIGFIFVKKIIIPSFGSWKKDYDDEYYVRNLIIFSFIVALFVFIWIVVYGYYKKEFEQKLTIVERACRLDTRVNEF